MIDGVLYMWVRNAGNSQFAWSADHAKTWQWCDWRFETSFGCPHFLNFAKTTPEPGTNTFTSTPRIETAPIGRRPNGAGKGAKGQIGHRGAYEFYKGLDGREVRCWRANITNAGLCLLIRGVVPLVDKLRCGT